MAMMDNDQSQAVPSEGRSESIREPSDSEGWTTSLCSERSHEARNMAMLCHVLGIAGFLGPLVIWLNERDKHRFVDEHGRAAMNYQISLLLYYAVSAILCVAYIGIPLLWALTCVHVVLVIFGAIRAREGKPWRYPIAIPFLE
jgi:uncharacterized Tic20 family protein